MLQCVQTDCHASENFTIVSLHRGLMFLLSMQRREKYVMKVQAPLKAQVRLHLLREVSQSAAADKKLLQYFNLCSISPPTTVSHLSAVRGGKLSLHWLLPVEMAKSTWMPILLHILHPCVIAEHLTPKLWALRCCYNNLLSSGKAFHKSL